MKCYLPIITLFSALFFVSCSSHTPQGRIEKNLALYNDLSVQEQELVSRGQIAEGMTPQAVFLAMGSPDRRLEGSNAGVRTMRWDYTSLSPIYTNSFYGHFGSGWGRYSRRYGGFGFSPTIHYVPTRSNSVWFENERVRSWERIR